MQVWAVVNQKGGVGKTTTVVSLGALLAEQGRRVLLLDLDPQGSLTTYFKGDPESREPGAFELFRPSRAPGRVKTSDLVVSTSKRGMSLIPGRTSLATLEKNLARQAGMGQAVSRALATLEERFDHVLIDTPPLMGLLLINALAAAERVIVPVQTEPMALSSLKSMTATLDRFGTSLKRPLPYHLVPTLYDNRTRASRQCLEQLHQNHAPHLWPSPIPTDTGFREAARQGVPLGDRTPDSPGWQAYRALVAHLLDQARA